ncbi:MAG: DNA cytosine methyltransferase [Planctomycetota bacterium]
MGRLTPDAGEGRSGLVEPNPRPSLVSDQWMESFLTGARGDFVIELLEPLIEAGYRIHLRKVNAAHFGIPQHRKRAFRRVMDGTPTERRGGAPAGVRRLRADEPSKAITGGVLREFLHPTEDRPLTLRECATLQTFPTDFHWKGSVSEKALGVEQFE